jgi:hypothetical protein
MFRSWTGLWTVLIILFFVMFNLSFLVNFITRFTEECFASLVAIVFIIDALKMTAKLKNTTKDQNKKFGFNETLDTDSFEINKQYLKKEATFYFSLILFIMALAICFVLKSFRNKTYLPTKVNFFNKHN